MKGSSSNNSYGNTIILSDGLELSAVRDITYMYTSNKSQLQTKPYATCVLNIEY